MELYHTTLSLQEKLEILSDAAKYDVASVSYTHLDVYKRQECPSASEKNAILLLTIIVPRIPNSGVMIRTARNAFTIKSY